MEKMLKGNNKLTAINVVLNITCCYLLFQISAVQAKQAASIINIQSALYWKLNIKTDAPSLPYDNSNEASTQHDVMLANTKQNHVAKKEN